MLNKLREEWRTKFGSDMSARTFKLFFYENVLNNKLYDVLSFPFYQEYTNGENGAYIYLQQRRPSVKFNICKKVVDDTVSLLFSESHFPLIDSDHSGSRSALQIVAKEKKLNEIFMEAAFRGSVGSVAILTGVVNEELFYQVLDSKYLSPVFDNDKTRNLVSVTQKYPTSGQELAARGYSIAEEDLDTEYWFMRKWTTKDEIVYIPWKIRNQEENFTPSIDKDSSTVHDLGYVPLVWIRNLPGGDIIDGKCTFAEAIEIMVEIDYQLSQGGRGLRYSSDPTLLIKAPTSLSPGETFTKGAKDALIIPEGGDAKLLEIAGTAAGAVNDFVKVLREFALESIHGNRSNTDKLSVAQSGKAMEMMNQDLIWLSDKLRTTYGEGGLVNLLRMTLKLIQANPGLQINGKALPEVDPNASIVLVWEPWYSYTPDDLQKTSIALTTLVSGKLLSRKTAIRDTASVFDVEDVDAELVKIDSDPVTDEATANTNEPSGKVPESGEDDA